MGQQRAGSAGRWPCVRPQARLTWLAMGPLCKKCQARVPRFLPFVRLCRDLEFTAMLAAPNNTHKHPLEKFSLSRPGSHGFLWKWLEGSRTEQWKVSRVFSLLKELTQTGQGEGLIWSGGQRLWVLTHL